MTSGRHNSWPPRSVLIRYAFMCLFFLSGIISLPVQAASWDLNALLNGFTRISSAEAQYTETRNSGFVDVPMIGHGRLTYRAPNYLAKRSSDGRSGYIVRGNVAEILGTQPTRRLHLDNYPPLAAIVAALRATLSGNDQVLDHYFHIQLSGLAGAWRLQLTPRQSSLAQIISSITLQGANNRIHKVVIQQVDGDYSILTLQKQVIRERQPSAP